MCSENENINPKGVQVMFCSVEEIGKLQSKLQKIHKIQRTKNAVKMTWTYTGGGE